MNELTLKDQVSIDEWDTFVSAHRTGTIFHATPWLETLRRNQGGTLLRLGFYQGAELVGLLPLIVKKLGPLRVAASPFTVEDTPYLGFVLDRVHLDASLAAVVDFQRRSRIHFLRLLQREDLEPASFEHNGFTAIRKHTHILDLSKSEDEIWKGFEGRCRTHVRKAEKEGVEIKEIHERDFLDTYYDMIDRLYRRQALKNPNCRQFYLDLWDAFARTNLTIFAAIKDQKCIAAAIFVHERDRYYYLNRTSLSEYNHLCANNLIQWTAIKHAKSCGAFFFDFVGSDIPRLAKFKKSFGGELVVYTCLERPSAKWVSLLRNQFTRYKGLIGRIARFAKGKIRGGAIER